MFSVCIEDRETHRMERRAEGALQFWHRVSEEGGVFTIGQAAGALGISQEQAESMIRSGQIFTILWDGENRIPGFQFVQGGFIEHFHFLLDMMRNEGYSDIFITSIFINTVTYTNGIDPVYRQLQSPIKKHQLIEVQRCVLGGYGR